MTTFTTKLKLERHIQDNITKHKTPLTRLCPKQETPLHPHIIKQILLIEFLLKADSTYSSDFSKRNFHLGSVSTACISTEQNPSAARVFAKCSLVASLPPDA